MEQVKEIAKEQENGKQTAPTHYALPLEVFQEVIKRIISLPYSLKETIEAITSLIDKNVVGISITKTNTDDKQNQTAPEDK